jgi:hypothetical protein
MGAEDQVGAVQLNAGLYGASPPITRRLVITEQASLAQLHAALQVAFGWSDEYLYVFRVKASIPADALEACCKCFRSIICSEFAAPMGYSDPGSGRRQASCRINGFIYAASFMVFCGLKFLSPLVSILSGF